MNINVNSAGFYKVVHLSDDKRAEEQNHLLTSGVMPLNAVVLLRGGGGGGGAP